MQIRFFAFLSVTLPALASPTFAQDDEGSDFDQSPERPTKIEAADVDGDGIPEQILFESHNSGGVGSVYVRNGDDGKLMWEHESQMLWGLNSVSIGELNGAPLVFIGIQNAFVDIANQPVMAGRVCVIDLNGPGIFDVIDGPGAGAQFGADVSAIGGNCVIGAPGASAIYRYSAATGELTTVLQGTPGSQLGRNVEAGEFDGDPNDWEIGASLLDPSSAPVLRVYGGLNSGVPHELTSHIPPADRDIFEFQVIGDLTGDNRPEWAITDYSADAPGMADAGAVDIVDLWSGTILRTLTGVVADDRIGVSLAIAQTNAGPVVVSGGLGANHEGSVRAWNVTTGELVLSRSGIYPQEGYGRDVAAGDFNHNGNDEVMIAVPGARVDGVQIVSIEDLLFSPTSPTTISALDGGTVHFELDDPDRPSAIYGFVVSASGTTPGVDFANQHFWLNLDALSVPWGQLFPGQFGVLDLNGVATGFVNMPGGLLRPGREAHLNLVAVTFHAGEFKSYLPLRFRVIQP